MHCLINGLMAGWVQVTMNRLMRGVRYSSTPLGRGAAPLIAPHLIAANQSQRHVARWQREQQQALQQAE